MFLNMVVRHPARLRKLALNVEDFCVETIGWGKKIMLLIMKHGKSGLFPCYRLKIKQTKKDFLSIYNQNLKVCIFTTLKQIRCNCKVGLAHYDSFRGGGSHFGKIRILNHINIV